MHNLQHPINNHISYCVYARKSTESEDRQVLSIPAQMDELKHTADEKGICLEGKPRTESMSAKAPGRPIFGQLMQDIQDNKVQGIVCWKLDRLARNPVDGGALIWALDQGKLKEIITPSRSFTNNGDDKFWMQLEFGMAKKYVDDLSVNVKRGIKKKLGDGGLPGRAPLGYLNDRLKQTVVKDNERFSLVRRMWEFLLSGQYSVKRIHAFATHEWGLRTRRCRRRGGGAMQLSNAYSLFANPFYCGLIRREGQLYKGKHEPMITMEEYRRAQAVMKHTERRKPEEHDFPLTGILRCAGCGRMITAELHIKKSGRRYVYYHCTSRNKPCSQRYLRAEDLERQVARFLDRVALAPEYYEWLLGQLENEEKLAEKGKTVQIEALQRELQTAQRRMDVLTRLRVSEEILPEVYRTQYNELLQDQVRLEEKMHVLHMGGKGMSEPIHSLISLLNSATIRYSTGNNDEKRGILWAIGQNPQLKDGELVISAKKPFQLLLERSQNSFW